MPVDFHLGRHFPSSLGARHYLMHSTALLAGVWLILKLNRVTGHSLRENLWKTALVGGVVTATAQILLAPQGPFGEIILAVDTFAPESSTPLPSSSVSMDATDQVSITPDFRQPTAIHASGNDSEYVPALDESSRKLVSVEDSPSAGSFPLPDEWLADDRETSEIAVICLDSVSRPVGRLAMPDNADFIYPRIDGRCGDRASCRSVGNCPLRLANIVVAEKTRGLSVDRRRAGPQTNARRIMLGTFPVFPQVRPASRRCTTPSRRLSASVNGPSSLPQRAAHDLPEAELRTLLAHELAHLVRGDSTWLLISRLVCSCLAFQPLNHLARREWQRAAEYLCDGWAVSRTTGTPLALARCLTEVAGWRRSGEASAAILAATGRKSVLADQDRTAGGGYGLVRDLGTNFEIDGGHFSRGA